MKKYILIGYMVLILGFTSSASAHVVVKPPEVGIGAFQTFTVGVPVEKEIPTTEIRLVIPSGLDYVTPNVKPGWKISVKKEGVEENVKVTEILWSGGSIPSGQRDEFIFSAKVPVITGVLQWKAYQTYQDGNIVAWDQDPVALSNAHHGEGAKPFSQTKVIDDLAPSDALKNSTTTSGSSLTFSLVALAFSLIAISIAKKAKNRSEV